MPFDPIYTVQCVQPPANLETFSHSLKSILVLFLHLLWNIHIFLCSVNDNRLNLSGL